MSSENLSEKHKQAELEKLGLEIQTLRKANKWWNIVIQQIPVLTALIAVSGLVFGIIQYNSQQTKDKDLREKEFKRKYWEKQLDVYSDISHSAARISTVNSVEERDKEYQRFRELYFGNFLMFADENVARSAKTFFQRTIDYRNDPKKQIDVQLSSKELANACRDSLRLTWDVPLKALDVAQY